MGCYRVYPPKHSPPANQCPDGSTNADAQSRTVRWGLTYHRYYQLPISYFLSSLGSTLLSTMSRNNLWVRVLSSASLLEVDNRARVPERVRKVTEKLSTVEAHLVHSGGHVVRGVVAGGYGGGLPGLGSVGRAGGGKRGAVLEELENGSAAGSEIAIEQCKGHATQMVKNLIFDYLQRQEQRTRDAAEHRSSMDVE